MKPEVGDVPKALRQIHCYNKAVSTISVQEIQADPGKFLERVESGEPLLVTSEDRVIARVQPEQSPVVGFRPFGLVAGEFITPADFDQPLPEDVLREFEGA